MDRIEDSYRESGEDMERKHSVARPFCEQNRFIERSTLFKAFCEMSKCNPLHIYDAAGLSTDGFIELLKDWVKACEGDKTIWPIYIVTKPGSRKIPGTLLYHPGDELTPFIQPLADFLKRQGSEDVLRNLISFSSENRAESIPYIWDEFNAIFRRTGELLENSIFYYMYHYRMFKEMIEDRIEYAEIRCSLTAFKDWENTPQSFEPWNLVNVDIPFLDIIKAAAETVIEDWNAGVNTEEQRKFKIRVILSTRRDIDILDKAIVAGENAGDKVLLKMDSAIVMKQNPKYEDFVVGFDLVSEEDRGKQTYTLYSRGLYENFCEGYKVQDNVLKGMHMLERNPELKQLRIQLLDFYLHDEERIWAGNENMIDAAIINRHRIGHGFNLSKYPKW